MLNLKEKRVRRSLKTRKRISELNVIRLSIHRTNLHIYAQLIDNKNNKTIASASTLEPEIRKGISSGSNITAAALIGKRIAEKGKECGISNIAFDRAGYKYHGRVRALADAARENGLKF
ncbi:50S ribosomal protein L18 [Nitrosomonas sp.]|uniref:50S ribosomal protein L18 n=1 Tax=Nitrosomonas sp. TaxID=42353 RepID=UPI002620406D|nr:50S ribosomal protein L18 [Nitrosomonas sp.]